MAFDEFQNSSVDCGPMRLHQIENECGRTAAALMHDSDSRIITLGHRLNLQFTLQNGVGVIQ